MTLGIAKTMSSSTDARLLGLVDSGRWRRATHAAIAGELGVSRRTVIRSIARLKARGVIEARQRRRRDGGKAAGFYRIAPHVTRRPETLVTRVVELVANHVEVDASAVLGGRGRRKQVALARQMAMYVAAVDLELSHEAIAGAFGRDRTTVGYALGRIEDRRDDVGFHQVLAELEAAVIAKFRPGAPRPAI